MTLYFDNHSTIAPGQKLYNTVKKIKAISWNVLSVTVYILLELLRIVILFSGKRPLYILYFSIIYIVMDLRSSFLFRVRPFKIIIIFCHWNAIWYFSKINYINLFFSPIVKLKAILFIELKRALGGHLNPSPKWNWGSFTK